MAELKPYKGGYYLWKYVPSVPLAVVFGILFLIATAAHGWRLYRTRLWFAIPMVVGGISYFVRVKASSETDKLMPYAIQNIFILLPPVLFAASIYMILSRLVRAVGGDMHSLVPVPWLTKIFVGGDVVSFMVQGGASGLMASGTAAELAQWIVVAGLLIQIAMFGFFIVTTVVFHHRASAAPLSATFAFHAARPVLYMLYAVSGLIMGRSVFRVIEFVMGNDGYPLEHEWTLYVFDSIPMVAVMGIYYIWYPDWSDLKEARHARVNSEEVMCGSGVNLPELVDQRV